jgi:hypothetical protein
VAPVGPVNGTPGTGGSAGCPLTTTLTGSGRIGGDLILTSGSGRNGGQGGAGADGTSMDPAYLGSSGGDGGDAGAFVLHLDPAILIAGALTLTPGTNGTGGLVGATGADLGGGTSSSGGTPVPGTDGAAPTPIYDFRLYVARGGTYVARRDGYAPGAAPAGGGTLWYDGQTLRQVSPDGTVTDVLPSPLLATTARTGTSETLVLSDAGKRVTMDNASANTLTVPPHSSVAFPVGVQIPVQQIGAGQTTLAAGAGVTINSSGGLLNLSGQWAFGMLIQDATDVWTFTGDRA